ncbi:SET and MYND domain-containing protein 4 [Aplysia californica]|uniref:Protein-lysine N-methyltransferase SMYD4 n=1 Tax=Aplysia californica TaxID=6500 RepID=A0ABM0K768_APLCA|nr:SET and MYND domain-containing protein 4 [Aplysia californica]
MAAPIGFGNWQLAIDKILQSIEPTDQFKLFASLSSNDDRVLYLLNNKTLRSVEWLPVYFDSCRKWHGKSTEVAQVWRNKGNRLFQRKRYQEAVAAYTQCHLSAPVQDGGDYVISLGNRSAALFHMEKYQECLTDVTRALASGFPKESRHKLLSRRVQAQIRLGQKVKAESSFLKLQDFVSGGSFCLTGEKRDAFLKEIESMEKDIKNLNNQSTLKASSQEPPKVFSGVNSTVPQATAAVTLTITPDQGRFLVANQSFPKGSTLIVERPFAAVLLPEHYESHCHHCFTALPSNPVGCCQCSAVRFCNESCRDAAWSLYHKVECPFLDLLHSVGVAHLSLRIVLTATLPYLKDFLKNPARYRSADEIPIKGVNRDGVYDRSYLSVFDLMTHEGTTASQDMLQYSLTAALLLVTLVQAEFFDGVPGISEWAEEMKTPSGKQSEKNRENGKHPNVPEEVRYIGAALLRHILQLVCNAHAITSLQAQSCRGEDDWGSGGDMSHNASVEADSLQNVQQVRIATAIYPTASLMNHSCDPTIISSFMGDVLIVRNIKDVKKGDEIYNCYGPHYCRMRTGERQEVLKSQYHFDCLCEACAQGDVSSQRFGAFQCPQCSGILRDVLCTECGQSMEKEKLEAYKKKAKQMDALFNSAVESQNCGNYKDALEKLQRCQRERRSILYRDHRDLALGEDAIAKCYASLGEFSASADHLFLSVQFAQLMYGDGSAEFAHELQKLAEVLFNAERFVECLEVSTQAVGLFEGLYSQGHEAVRQTRELAMAAQMALMPVMEAT